MKNIFIKKVGGFVLAAAVPIALLGCAAAMNGGTAVTTGAFDIVVDTLKGMLSSSWTIMLALIVLLVAVWQLAHGGGYKTVGLVLGVLALALVGPGFLTTIFDHYADGAAAAADRACTRARAGRRSRPAGAIASSATSAWRLSPCPFGNNES